MGKVTGFLESSAHESRPTRRPIDARIKNYNEFVIPLPDDEGGHSQQGARCMDCGIPFCHNGCPVNNHHPGLERPGLPQATMAIRARRAAFDQQFPGVHRAHLPRALRGGVHV